MTIYLTSEFTLLFKKKYMTLIIQIKCLNIIISKTQNNKYTSPLIEKVCSAYEKL